MQISSITPNLSINGINTPKRQSFGSYLCIDRVSNSTLDSAFFRENKTLQTVIKNLEKGFPNGAAILDYACSNGEEAISLLAQLKNRFKYAIKAFDISPIALERAKTGEHSVFSGFLDSFLIGKTYSNEEANLKKLFLSVMQPIEKPSALINGSLTYTKLTNHLSDFEEKYFKVKNKYMTLIEYSKGDIRNLNNLEFDRPVGAILFRNAFYHLCNNRIIEALEGKNRNIFYSDKIDVAEDIVNKVHQKLEKGGVFAIGDHFKDNIFIADKSTPIKQTVKFKDTAFFTDKYVNAKEVLFIKKSPIVTALLKDGKFRPVHYSYVEFLGNTYKYPTVWKKV